jgi:hypothetical protein
MEAIGGIAAVVLAIIGLAGGLRPYVAAIAVILIGASLLLESGTLAASYRRLLLQLEGSAAGTPQLGGTMSIECLAGFTGIVLGILALLGVSAGALIATAVIVFGCAFMLNSGSLMRLHSLWADRFFSQTQSREVANEAVATGAAGHLMIGLAAVVLGILAVVGINTLVLNLVALLALGISVMLAGSFFGATRFVEKHA